MRGKGEEKERKRRGKREEKEGIKKISIHITTICSRNSRESFLNCCCIYCFSISFFLFFLFHRQYLVLFCFVLFCFVLFFVLFCFVYLSLQNLAHCTHFQHEPSFEIIKYTMKHNKYMFFPCLYAVGGKK
jgi:hypothetical protein